MDIDAILKGVHPGWLALFDRELLAMAWARVCGEQLAPPPALVFEAFRYCGPDDCDVCILGQDPYPAPGDAQGLAFSSRLVPKSAKALFACLHASGMTLCAPVSADLRSWAAQGVLLINIALTTRVGVSKVHMAAWDPFVRALIIAWARRRAGRPPHFMLWGGPAKSYAPTLRMAGIPPTAILEWSHPSSLGDMNQPQERKFARCDHFTIVAAARREAGLPAIVWDNAEPALIFCDGGCVGMRGGAPRASYGVVCTGAAFGTTWMSGPVAPYEYALADPARPELGLIATSVAARPTNNRGEFLAFSIAIAAALRAGLTGNIEICSDSKNTLRTFDTWYPDRLAKRTGHEMKNQDFVKSIWIMFSALKSRAQCVVLTHRRGHQPRPPPSAPARSRALWLGNDVVDKLAARQLATRSAQTVVSPLACLR